MSTITYKKNSNTTLSTHFKSREFMCPCSDCKETIIDKILVSQLEALRTLLGSSLKITSGYRCANYQEQLRIRGYETAKGISQHELGKAADITDGVTPGIELEDMARRVGFKSVGVGRLFIHVDTRPEERRWTYKT